MYAIVEIMGSQVKVEKDDKIVVNRIKFQKSTSLRIDKVLFGKKGASVFVGDPYVKDAYVDCEILGDKRGPKVIAFKYRDRKSSQSTRGHRQDLTELRVKDIHLDQVTESPSAEEKEKQPQEKKQKEEKKDKKVTKQKKTDSK